MSTPATPSLPTSKNLAPTLVGLALTLGFVFAIGFAWQKGTQKAKQ